MQNFDIILLQRVGNVFFGMARDNARNLLGEFSEFKRNKYSKNTTDNFGFCQIAYNTQNEVEAIGFFRYNSDVKLFLDNISLFDIEYKELVAYIGELDNELQIDSDGFSSNKGIRAYAPEGKTESILLTAKDY